jgi:hypothetical protein
MSIVQKIIASSDVRTATETFNVESNANPTGLFIIDVTAGAGAGDTVTISIDGYDQASEKYYNLLTSAVINAVETRILRVGMDFPEAANLAVKDFLPKTFRVVATKNNATAITYSIGVNLKG